MIICSLVAFPLAISMITVGAISIEQCSKEVNNSSSLTTGIVIKLHHKCEVITILVFSLVSVSALLQWQFGLTIV